MNKRYDLEWGFDVDNLLPLFAVGCGAYMINVGEGRAGLPEGVRCACSHEYRVMVTCRQKCFQVGYLIEP